MSGPDAREVQRRLDAWLARHEPAMVESLRALLAIESVKGEAHPGRPFGEGVGQALDFVARLAADQGMATLDADGYAVHGELGGGAELVGVLAHVDVVPAGSGWSVPPFGGELRDGRIYGRGAVDDKGPTVAALYGSAALLHSGAPLSRRVRVIVGGDEESGFQCLRYYFARHEKPRLAFSPDAYFPVVHAEKGILNFALTRPVGPGMVVRAAGGLGPNVVPDRAEAELAVPPGDDPQHWAQRLREAARGRRARIAVEGPASGPGGSVRLTLLSHGLATHGSTPEKGINAAAELLACLAEADRGEGRLDPEGAAAFLGRVGLDVYGRALEMARRDDVSGPLTANLGVLRWEAGRVEAVFDVRYPVSLPSAEPLVEGARRAAGRAGFEVAWARDDPPHHVPEESFLVRELLRVYREVTGDDGLGPLAIGGGTYARLLPEAVGFGPVCLMRGAIPHEKDEYIELEHLRLLARIYAAALWALAC